MTIWQKAFWAAIIIALIVLLIWGAAAWGY